ncbi:cysteine hydrolase family protein [Aquimarina hainanensis]|uniref:Cysteine hydrolase family protein n=1 Tax=Aquimarina hainanensis TaxID=1578017 RepID=A0ABW5N7Z0_9FLAO
MLSKNQKTLPVLLLIDIQKGFDDIAYWGGERNNPTAEENIKKILDLWREKQLPLFHIQHCSVNPISPLAAKNPGNEFKDIVTPLPTEVVIKKSVNSAFIGTDLKERLNSLHADTVIIVGLTTDHCVSTTTRMAANFGYNTFLIHDATATFNKKDHNGQLYSAQEIHDTAIASLHEEFATILNTDTLLLKITSS